MFTQEKADAICRHLESGASLRKACEQENGPDPSTVLRWTYERPEFAQQYARARDIGNDRDFDALAEIQSQEPERSPTGGVDSGWVAWKRLQIDTMKWSMAKKAPKKYGEKTETTLEVGESVTKVVREIVRAG